MRFLQFNMIPLPYCGICGEDFYTTSSDSHPDRDYLKEFDLLVVTKGVLPIAEENTRWDINAGQALILRPNMRHYQPESCNEPTHFFWIHFQTSGSWSESILDETAPRDKPAFPINNRNDKASNREEIITYYTNTKKFTYNLHSNPLTIKVAQFSTLLNPEKTYADFRTLIKLQQQLQTAARWKQQIIFQNVLEDLSAAHNQLIGNSLTELADRVAIFLRENYSKDINYKILRQQLNFHPVYLARCMQKVYGCTPIEYLTQIRLEQAKLLLVNSDVPIGKIAEEVGFHHLSYFTRSFSKQEGIPPQLFRKQFKSNQ